MLPKQTLILQTTLKKYNMKKIIRLTESDLTNIVKKVLSEQRVNECIVDGDTLCPIKCKQKVAKKKCPKSYEVKQLQNALAKGGFYQGEGGGMSKACATDINSCDGIFDWRTEQAVKEYQKSKPSLMVDGVVGYNTLMSLISDKLIQDPGCQCTDSATYDPGEKWYEGIGTGDKYADCDTIKNCLLKAKKNKGDEWNSFLECFKSPKGDCPEYVNCMPGTSGVDKRCNNSEFRKRCPNTRFVY